MTGQRHGHLRTIQIHPGDYACATLAAQLADELIAYARVAALRDATGLAVAVRSFLQFTSERVLSGGTDPLSVRLETAAADLAGWPMSGNGP